MRTEIFWAEGYANIINYCKFRPDATNGSASATNHIRNVSNGSSSPSSRQESNSGYRFQRNRRARRVGLKVVDTKRSDGDTDPEAWPAEKITLSSGIDLHCLDHLEPFGRCFRVQSGARNDCAISFCPWCGQTDKTPRPPPTAFPLETCRDCHVIAMIRLIRQIVVADEAYIEFTVTIRKTMKSRHQPTHKKRARDSDNASLF